MQLAVPLLAVQRLLQTDLVQLGLARANRSAQIRLLLPLTASSLAHVLSLLLLQPRDLIADVLPLLVELLLHRGHHAATVLLRLHERVVVARPVLQIVVDELDDLLRHAVQELAVVAHDDRGSRVVADVVLQPDNGVQIQMVGRLVQQEDIGLDEERARDGHAHSPSSAEHLGGHRELLVGELETFEDLARTLLGSIALDVLQALIDLLQTRHDRFHAAASLALLRVLGVRTLQFGGQFVVFLLSDWGAQSLQPASSIALYRW